MKTKKKKLYILKFFMTCQVIIYLFIFSYLFCVTFLAVVYIEELLFPVTCFDYIFIIIIIIIIFIYIFLSFAYRLSSY